MEHPYLRQLYNILTLYRYLKKYQISAYEKSVICCFCSECTVIICCFSIIIVNNYLNIILLVTHVHLRT